MAKTKTGRPVKPARAGKSSKQPAVKSRKIVVEHVDEALFAPLTEGERAAALRLLLDDERARQMAKIGRYRISSVEQFVVKPPHPLTGRRLARVVLYDYASERCVEATVDLERSEVAELTTTTAQPVLSLDEQLHTIQVALGDDRVRGGLGADDSALSVLLYWSRRPSELAYRRRSAAVVFGSADSPRPSLVAVVDLSDGVVTEVVPAEQW
jgi:hypothetical protein